MDFDKVTAEISALGLNLYDFALYADGAVRTHRFQPCGNCLDSYSVAKAFIMSAIGLLWDDGRLRMTDALCALFPDKTPADMDPAWRMVTLEHAMTHRAGFDKSTLDIDTEDMAEYPEDDYLHMLFSMKLGYLPGTERVYTDAAFYLLSRAAERLAGETVDAFLYKRLLKPMHFHEIAWSRDPQGHPIGATGLYIGASDMVKLGMLYLNGGVYEGKRLLSKAWVDHVLTNEYELHMMTQNGLIGKGGMLGQGLCFSREKGFAAAWHGCQAGAESKKMVDYMDGLCL